jgi:hypothetical protein
MFQRRMRVSSQKAESTFPPHPEMTIARSRDIGTRSRGALHARERSARTRLRQGDSTNPPSLDGSLELTESVDYGLVIAFLRIENAALLMVFDVAAIEALTELVEARDVVVFLLLRPQLAFTRLRLRTRGLHPDFQCSTFCISRRSLQEK